MDTDSAGEDRLFEVVLDPSAQPRRGPDVDHECRIAIYDLVECNRFALKRGAEGPYRLRLRREEGRLVFEVESRDGRKLGDAALALAPLRSTLKSYETICDSYHEAIKTAPRSRIEAIDMGRRACHTEGAELLREALSDKIEIDGETARRVFTLIHALHVRL